MQQSASKAADLIYGGTKSHTRRDVTLSILDKPDETITFPLEITTKVIEVIEMLKMKLGTESQLKFIVKQASSYRTLTNFEEMRSKVTVRGLKSFTREKAKYPYPFAIIGAGHSALKLALNWTRDGYDYICYDRHSIVGGTAWVTNANPTSKLQTELGVYHLQFDVESVVPKMPTWPTRGDLLKHFQECADEFGITPNLRLSTDVTSCETIDNKTLDPFNPKFRYFSVISEKTDGSSEDESVCLHSAVGAFPGGLKSNKLVEYKGEDVFEGQIGYGMFSQFDYTKVAGETVSIIGMGAFAVENVRTCMENNAEKAYIVCRRKNLTVPRIPDWLMNASVFPPPANMILSMMEPAYKLMDDDPWEYYSVIANKDRTTVNVKQASRFGIGDFIYLACAYGKCEIVVDQVKRLKADAVVLEGGDRLECEHLCKAIGFTGDFTFEKVMQVKEMVGNHVNGDFRRFAFSEFPGVDFSKCGGTSLSPGALWNSLIGTYFLDYPKDYARIAEANALPKKKPNDERPVYVWDPRIGGSLTMMYTSCVPGLGEAGNAYNGLNRKLMHQAHPMEDYLAECKADWFNYCEMWKKNGDDRPFPEYPYSLDDVKYWFNKNDSEGFQDMQRMMGLA